MHKISTDFDIRSFYSITYSFPFVSRYLSVIISDVCPSSFCANSFPFVFSCSRSAKLRILWNVGGFSSKSSPEAFRVTTNFLVSLFGGRDPSGLFFLISALSMKLVMLVTVCAKCDWFI